MHTSAINIRKSVEDNSDSRPRNSQLLEGKDKVLTCGLRDITSRNSPPEVNTRNGEDHICWGRFGEFSSALADLDPPSICSPYPPESLKMIFVEFNTNHPMYGSSRGERFPTCVILQFFPALVHMGDFDHHGWIRRYRGVHSGSAEFAFGGGDTEVAREVRTVRGLFP